MLFSRFKEQESEAEKFSVRLLLLGKTSEMAQHSQGNPPSPLIMIPPETKCSVLSPSAPNSSCWLGGHILQLYLSPCPSQPSLCFTQPCTVRSCKGNLMILNINLGHFKKTARSDHLTALITRYGTFPCTFVPQTKEQDVSCLITVVISNPLLLAERFFKSPTISISKSSEDTAIYCRVWLGNVSEKKMSSCLGIPCQQERKCTYWQMNRQKKEPAILEKKQSFSIISMYLTAKFTCKARAQSKHLQHNPKNTEGSRAMG